MARWLRYCFAQHQGYSSFKDNLSKMATQALPEALTAPTQTFDDVPPFPDDVPTAPLLRLSLAKLIQRDAEEVHRFVRASEDLGFFYLDLNGPGDSLLADADQLFKVGAELFELPLEEKKKYDFQHKKSYFGYKGFGANVADRYGNLDRNEFYNVSGFIGRVVIQSLIIRRCRRTICLESWIRCPLRMCSVRDAPCSNLLSHPPMPLSRWSWNYSMTTLICRPIHFRTCTV